MTLTRAQNEVALQHILKVMYHEPDSVLHKALAHASISKILYLVSMSDDDIKALEYPVTDEATGDITLHELANVWKAHILIIQEYVLYRQDLEDPIDNKWTDITADQLNAYRVFSSFRVYIKTQMPNSLKPNYPPCTDSTAVSNSKKGIKRDPTVFRVFKQQSDWDDWSNHIIITARGQAVEDVLDSSYKPVDSDEK